MIGELAVVGGVAGARSLIDPGRRFWATSIPLYTRNGIFIKLYYGG